MTDVEEIAEFFSCLLAHPGWDEVPDDGGVVLSPEAIDQHADLMGRKRRELSAEIVFGLVNERPLAVHVGRQKGACMAKSSSMAPSRRSALFDEQPKCGSNFSGSTCMVGSWGRADHLSTAAPEYVGGRMRAMRRRQSFAASTSTSRRMNSRIRHPSQT